MKKKRKAYELTGTELETYRTGFQDGEQGDYFPGGLDQAIYDWGHSDGQKQRKRKS